MASPAKPTGFKVLGHTFNHASNITFLWLSAIVILFGTTTTFSTPYSKSAVAPVYSGNTPYDFSTGLNSIGFSGFSGFSMAFSNFQFILVSVIVGFPLLAITSKRVAWSVAYTSFFIAALTLVWAQLLKGFWVNGRRTYHHPDLNGWLNIPLGWDSLLLAVYLAATVQVAYSAVAGRVSFAQALGLAFFAAFFATANQQIGEEVLIYDSGGSFNIHTFGAIFGLAASRFIFDRTKAEKHSNAEARDKVSGVQSFIGTALVFAIYPVFNSGLVAYTYYTNLVNSTAGNTIATADSAAVITALTFRSYYNTLFAVAASTAAAFLISKASSTRGTTVNLAHVQTAAVAGGAAVASFAHALASPWGALLTGAVTGAVAVWGIILVQPLLEKARFFDASAVFSAHAIPGFIGAIGSAIAFNRVSGNTDFSPLQIVAIIPDGRDALKQGGYQIAYWTITAVFAAISGGLTGLLLNLPIFEAQTSDEATLNDDRDSFDPIAESDAASVYAPKPQGPLASAYAVDEGAAAPTATTSAGARPAEPVAQA